MKFESSRLTIWSAITEKLFSAGNGTRNQMAKVKRPVVKTTVKNKRASDAEIARYYDGLKDVDLFNSHGHKPFVADLPKKIVRLKAKSASSSKTTLRTVSTTWIEVPTRIVADVKKIVAKLKRSA